VPLRQDFSLECSMAYDLFLMACDGQSAASRKDLLKKLRQTALAILPADDRGCKVGTINGGRFKIDWRGTEVIVKKDGVDFSIEDFQAETIPLIYALAKAGDMFIIEACGPSNTVVMGGDQVKRLPAEFRDPKPAVCKSLKDLPRLLGVSSKDIQPAPTKTQKISKKYEWSKKHENHSGRGALPGLRDEPREVHVFLQVEADEDIVLLLKRFGQFLRERIKKTKVGVPEGGGIWPTDWRLRIPTGEVFLNCQVTGYQSRPNRDHLIGATIEKWQKVLGDFARHSKRAIGTIVAGKKFVLASKKTYLLTACESRRVDPDDI
jgi:hypothetical protein